MLLQVASLGVAYLRISQGGRGRRYRLNCMLALHCFAQGTPASLSAGKSPHDHRKGFLTLKSKTKYCMSGFGPYLNMAGHTKTLTTPPPPSSTTHQQDTTTHRSATQPSSQPSHHSSNRKNRAAPWKRREVRQKHC